MVQHRHREKKYRDTWRNAAYASQSAWLAGLLKQALTQAKRGFHSHYLLGYQLPQQHPYMIQE